MDHNNNIYYNDDRYKIEEANRLEVLENHSYVISSEKINKAIVKQKNRRNELI
ncbi:hypothetical protein KPL37_06755 [Clostridium frigoris]|uniref:Uncharacterized protein n=1 Tax=Clostridium frigoris TaxID=205327 RepID=A0ABS6BR91_9CLOT|nr:hypothetical protein [Clostridium frigoris]MBU3159453.1 hypothetical protein [Clostridium frigoris]